MFRHILVPLDGSPRAEAALPVAAHLARASGGTVAFVRVVDPQRDLAPYVPSDLEEVQRMVHAEEVAARSYLRSLPGGILPADVPAETVVLCGRPATRILSEGQTRRVDLVVLCSHGSGYAEVKRQVLGSVAEEVVHHAPMPVLLLWEESAPPLGTDVQPGRPLRVLVPLAGSASAGEALVPVAQLVANLSAPGAGALHLVRVVVLPEAAQSSRSERDALLRQARDEMERAVAHLRSGPSAEPGLSLSWSIATGDDVAETINRLAEVGEPGSAGGPDLIALATHGLGEQRRWAMGSVTQRVLSTSRLPLLIVGPPRGENASSKNQGEGHKRPTGEGGASERAVQREPDLARFA